MPQLQKPEKAMFKDLDTKQIKEVYCSEATCAGGGRSRLTYLEFGIL